MKLACYNTTNLIADFNKWKTMKYPSPRPLTARNRYVPIATVDVVGKGDLLLEITAHASL